MKKVLSVAAAAAVALSAVIAFAAEAQKVKINGQDAEIANGAVTIAGKPAPAGDYKTADGRSLKVEGNEGKIVEEKKN